MEMDMSFINSKNVDITGGPIVKSVMIYTLPVIFGTLVQVLFNSADLMVVGNMADEVAVASVGATGSVVSLFVNAFVGLSAGVNAVLARCLGSNDEARAKRVVGTSLISAFALGLTVMALSLCVSGYFLEITDCPDDCFAGAELYLDIYAIGIPAIIVYNFGAAIIRTSGDTVKPFIYLVIAGLLNVGFNFLFCVMLEQKVAAVAIATVLSQTIACVLVLLHIFRLKGACGINVKKLAFSFREFGGILKIGAPCALNSTLFSLSNLQIQATLNSYGTEAIAGSSSAATIQQFISSINTGFNASTVPFVGQNIGAGNKKRVAQSVRVCFLLSTSMTLAFSVIFYLLGEPILTLYLPKSPLSVEYGMIIMRYTVLLYTLPVAYSIFVSAMQAFGYSIVPMINSIITVLVFRMIWLTYIYPKLDAVNHVIDNLYICYPISWALTLLAHATMFFIIYVRYKHGKVKRI